MSIIDKVLKEIDISREGKELSLGETCQCCLVYLP